jgi:uncharacterized membrane protein
MNSKKEQPNKEILDRWHDDPSNWKFGVLYFNKEDKRIFPPKRLKALGWTINFANPYSIVTLATIIVIATILNMLLR